MIVRYHTDFNSILLDDLDVQLEVLEEDKFTNGLYSKLYLESKSSNYFIGIPVLSKLRKKNPIIGHHFFNVQDDDKIGVFTFSYDLEEKKYINLPKFTLNILKCSTKDCCEFKFESKKSKAHLIKKYYYIDLKIHPLISLNSTRKDHYGPIFFQYNIKQIILKRIDCNCGEKCDICKLNFSEKYINCKYFNPPDPPNIGHLLL